MSDRSAAFAEIKTAEAAPAIAPVRPPVVDTTAAPVANPDIAAANEESFGKKALSDDTVTLDLYNDGGSGELTADQKATKALKEWSVPGDWNIGGNGGGPLSKQDLADRAEKKREQDLDDLIEMIKETHAQREREEERVRKWESDLHEVGGHKFTGLQIREMNEFMKDEKHQDQFEDELVKREGITKEEAKKRRQKVQEFLDLKTKEGTPGVKLNSDEITRLKKLAADPQLGEDIKVTLELQKKAGAALDKNNIQSKTGSEREAAASSFFSDDTKGAATSTAKVAYQAPPATGFSSSETLIKAEGITETYNTLASRKVADPAKPEVVVATSAPPKLENTIQVSGNGFG